MGGVCLLYCKLIRPFINNNNRSNQFKPPQQSKTHLQLRHHTVHVRVPLLHLVLMRRQVCIDKQERRPPTPTAPAPAPVPGCRRPPVDPHAEERGLRALVVENVAHAAGHLADVQRGEVRDEGFPGLVDGVFVGIGWVIVC